MKKILFDTDVLIEHLRDNEDVDACLIELHSAHAQMAYTPVSEAEIYGGLRSHERQKTQMILNYFECLPLTKEIGRMAGEYLRKYAKSHGLEIGDALIAASANFYDFALCTFNWKHYPMQDIERYRISQK